MAWIWMCGKMLFGYDFGLRAAGENFGVNKSVPMTARRFWEPMVIKFNSVQRIIYRWFI